MSSPIQPGVRARRGTVLDFINVIEAGGSLFPMADQVRCAITWIARNAATFGGDPDRIHIFGRLSGAHLGGVAITTHWDNDFGLPGDVIKGALLVVRDVRSETRATVEAVRLRQVHRRDGARAVAAPPSASDQLPGHRRAWHLRDARISTAGP